jgi:exopolyphosphatase/pppGpp-phosphohydrolase
MIEQGPQPHMVQALAGLVFSQKEEFAKEHELRADTIPLIVIILRGVIELLDSKCREKLL